MTSPTDKRRRERKTPRQRVLKEFPQAKAVQFRDEWVIYTPEWNGNVAIGNGRTAALAWADAERNQL